MARIRKFKQRPKKKSLHPSETNQEWEDKKIILVFLGMIIIFTLIALFMWWVRKTLLGG